MNKNGEEEKKKINIYVPENIGVILDNDATMFEILKKDKRTVNRNRFLSMIILGYSEEYADEKKEAYDKIMSLIDTDKISVDKKSVIANKIMKEVVLPEVPTRKGKHPRKLSLKQTNDTKLLIENAISNLEEDDYISQYFCRLFISYCNKPFSERERILFKKNYSIIQEACKKRTSITFKTIWNDEVINEVIPYKVVTGPEEMFNYLLCVGINKKDGSQNARSFRLNRIGDISKGNVFEPINEDVRCYLDKMEKYGPQYTINDEDEICVRLTAAGEKAYNRIYYGRPKYERVEIVNGDQYLFFRCSKNQVYLYFRRFEANQVEIISPVWLREKMIDFHKRSLEIYGEK